MWVNKSKIPLNDLIDKDFILTKFNCGLCNTETEIDFYGFDYDFYIKRPKYVWELNLGCPYCDNSNYHVFKIYTDSGFLVVNIHSEYIDSDSRDVDQDLIFYSLDAGDKSEYCIEIPLEFDVIDTIIGNDFYSNYTSAIKEISEIIAKPEFHGEKVILKILYSNVFSILEAYLFDLIINAVNSNEICLRKIVEDYDIFKKEKIEKRELFITYDNIKSEVLRELQKIVYHNLNIVIPLYKKTLSIDISEKVKRLPKEIEIRHDIVHRNGKDFEGNEHTITVDKIEKLIMITDDLVGFIDTEFSGLKKKHMFFLPRNK